MLERMPEDNRRPLSLPVVEVDNLHLPHIQPGMRRLIALFEADRDPPRGLQRVE
jgi:hypothetical protein